MELYFFMLHHCLGSSSGASELNPKPLQIAKKIFFWKIQNSSISNLVYHKKNESYIEKLFDLL